MARFSVLLLRLMAVGSAASVLLFLAHGGAHAQMIGPSVSQFQAAQEAAMNPSAAAATASQTTQSTPSTYVSNGVAQPLGLNGQRDPYAYYGGQPGAPAGMYAAPMGYNSSLPAGIQTQAPQAGAQPYAVPAYGGPGEPSTAPAYSIQAQPTDGAYAPAPYAPAPQAYAPPQQAYAPPQYAAPQQAYAPPQQAYAPPQYAAPQQAYAPPQYAPPQQAYGPPPAPSGVTSVAMSPANNAIASPYAAMRASATPAPPGKQTEGGYTLGPGDKVRLTVFGETDLSGEYQLDGNGNIRLPLAGTVHAGGQTAQGLEAVVYNALVPNFLRNPRLTVEITSYRPIYVVGQVQKPGQYAYVNDMTMMNAIGLAGGFTPQARESSVYVRREGESGEELVSTAQPLLVRPGDTIRVDTTLFWDAMNAFAPISGPAYVAAAAVH